MFTRQTAFPPRCVTQSAPPTRTTFTGLEPTRIVSTTAFRAGSILDSVPSPVLGTTIDPSAASAPIVGFEPTATGGPSSFVARSSRHPNCIAADGERGRALRVDLERVDPAVRVNAVRQRPVVGADPERVEADLHVREVAGQLEAANGPPAGRVDPREQPGVRRPDGPVEERHVPRRRLRAEAARDTDGPRIHALDDARAVPVHPDASGAGRHSARAAPHDL